MNPRTPTPIGTNWTHIRIALSKKLQLLLFFLAAYGGLASADILLTTGFEDSTSLPSGWSETSITGSAPWKIQTGGGPLGGLVPSLAHGGTNNATLFSKTRGVSTRLISPTFDTIGFTSLSLSFWHVQAIWGANQDELKVLYSSDGGATWTQLAQYITKVNIWTKRTISIPTASANSRIAFEGLSNSGYGVCLDDVQVTGNNPNNSELSISATDASASEAGEGTGTWTISRTGSTANPLIVNFTLSGSATAGTDYTLNNSSPIHFAAGETSKVITLTPINDSVMGEGDEIAKITLNSGSGYTFATSSANINIVDDDAYDLNILLIGSTHSFSEKEIGTSGVIHEKPFNPTAISTHLRSILSQDAALGKTVNVVFEDIFKTKFVETALGGNGGLNGKNYHCYSLFQHLMWPDGKADRLSKLRGEGAAEWDYIVVCEDPYVMANFTGMYAEAVKMLKDEVAKSANPAQIVLLAQWPESTSGFSANFFNEIVHRVGDSAGLSVVPAGKAWDSYGSKDTSTAHPTPRGEYLAAASIYSKLYNRSAKTSAYSYPTVGSTIADHALSVVQANAGVSQYSGFFSAVNVFQMKYYRGRQVDWNEYGTSTEDGFAEGLRAALYASKILNLNRPPPASGNPVDLSYSRGNFEFDKRYQVNPLKHDRVCGFPVGDHSTTGRVTMLYGIDKRYESWGSFENGTDLGIAYDMVKKGEAPLDVRAIPVRLMWSKLDHLQPSFPEYADGWHMGYPINWAVGAYMYTLLSGRCPIDAEPANQTSSDWQKWFSRKLGYETAWQMAHLTTRVPGFRVAPSSGGRFTVTTDAPETMTVQFLYPPTSNVTVSISNSDPSVATVSPSTLTFTPSNYNIPQQVTVTGKVITPATAPFSVGFSTSSNDKIYNGLSDSWDYEVLRDSSTVDLIAGFDGNNFFTEVASTRTLSDPQRGIDAIASGVTATFWTSDWMRQEPQWTAANQTSLRKWGTLPMIPTPVTLNTINVATFGSPASGTKPITWRFRIDNTAGTKVIDLQKLHFSAARESTAALELTIAYDSGDLAGTSTVKTLTNSTNTNIGYDVDLSDFLTDRILAPGESATFAIMQTTFETGRLKIDDIGISGVVGLTTPLDYFSSWAYGRGLGNLTAPSDNPDGDQLTNFQEYAFGLNPADPTTQALDYVVGGSVIQPGIPKLVHEESGFSAVFSRRKDHSEVGLSYIVQFSADLALWTTSSVSPTRLTSALSSEDYEVVGVPYPQTVPVSGGGAQRPTKFFRLGVQSN